MARLSGFNHGLTFKPNQPPRLNHLPGVEEYPLPTGSPRELTEEAT